MSGKLQCSSDRGFGMIQDDSEYGSGWLLQNAIAQKRAETSVGGTDYVYSSNL